MKRTPYKTKINVALKNRLNNETMFGDIVDEKEIDGRQYWVVKLLNREQRVSLAKESWTITKGK